MFPWIASSRKAAPRNDEQYDKDIIMKIQTDDLIQTYQSVRTQTTDLCMPLVNEDYVIQSIEDVSPPKWHLAHTTWFFETFLLLPYHKKYSIFDAAFPYLFNSYYQSLGKPYPRAQRGLLSRPTVEAVYAYRKYVDDYLLDYLSSLSKDKLHALGALLKLGINHEQQHQELLLMDIKYNFSINPLAPSYCAERSTSKKKQITKLKFIPMKSGVTKIGYQDDDFCFDNELPSHQVLLKPYEIASRLITNAEYAEFIQGGGYQSPEWWLSDGWDAVLKNNWHAPLYWHQNGKSWKIFTLNGVQECNPYEPVAHISYYEADAYARWKKCRLPTEAEWEHYANNAADSIAEGNFLENLSFHPQAAKENHQQLLGDLWEWTTSAYSSYPGFKPLSGALGEYNGKFMSNQMVLRGGCCVTPRSHIRASYRNFFAPDKRWQFSGIRLARDL